MSVVDLAAERALRVKSPPPQPHTNWASIVFCQLGSWRFMVADLEGEHTWFSDRLYPTEDAARAAALAGIERLRSVASP
jgi:hypothetical protein